MSTSSHQRKDPQVVQSQPNEKEEIEENEKERLIIPPVSSTSPSPSPSLPPVVNNDNHDEDEELSSFATLLSRTGSGTTSPVSQTTPLPTAAGTTRLVNHDELGSSPLPHNVVYDQPETNMNHRHHRHHRHHHHEEEEMELHHDEESVTEEVVAIVSGWNIILRHTWWILLILLLGLLWPCGLMYALPAFQRHTDSTFHHGIEGSLSRIAEQVMEHEYSTTSSTTNNCNHSSSSSSTSTITSDHSLVLQPSWILVVQAKSTSNINLAQDNYTQQLALNIQDYLLQTGQKDDDEEEDDYHQNSTKKNNDNNVIVQVLSYYTFQQENLTILAKPFMSNDGKTTMIQIQYDILQCTNDDNTTTNTTTTPTSSSGTSSGNTIITESDLMERLYQYYTIDYPPPSTGDISVSVTGLDQFSQDLRLSTQHDLRRMDWMVIPAALLLVGLVLQSKHNLSTTAALGVIWIIPLCAIASTIATWSLLMTPIAAHYMQITQFTPSIMMSLTLGMGIDYTLFLVSRYLESMLRLIDVKVHHHQEEEEVEEEEEELQQLEQEQHDNNNNNEEENDFITTDMKQMAIYDMLRHGGQVVFVSGCTLLCTFLGLVALPLPMLKSIGVGAAVTLASTMVINVIIVVPTLLYSPIGTWIVTVGEDVDRRRHHHRRRHLPRPITTRTTTSRSNSSISTPYMTELQDELLPIVAPTTNAMVATTTRRSAAPAMNGDSNGGNSELHPQSSTTQQQQQRGGGVQQEQRGGTATAVLVQSPPYPQSFWVRLCRNYLLHPYKSVVCLVLTMQLLWLPVAKNVIRVDSSDISFEKVLPKNAPSLKAYHVLEEEIGGGPGKLTPFRLLFVHKPVTEMKNAMTMMKKNSNSSSSSSSMASTTPRIDSSSAFEEMHRVIYHLLHPLVNFSVTDNIFQSGQPDYLSMSNEKSSSGSHDENQTMTVLNLIKTPTEEDPEHVSWWSQSPYYQQQRQLARSQDDNADRFLMGSGNMNMNMSGWSAWFERMTPMMTIEDDDNDSTLTGTTTSKRAPVFGNSEQLQAEGEETQDDIRAKRLASLAKFTGITVWNNIPIPYGAYLAAKVCTRQEPNVTCPIESMRALNVLDHTVTSPNRGATFVTVSLSVSPFSEDGIAWLDQSRQILQAYQEYNNNHKTGYDPVVDMYIDGTAAIAHDAVRAVYDNFVQVIAITIVVVMMFMGWFFQSIVPPLRSIISIFFTLTFSYGLAVLVFQDGIVQNWTAHLRSLVAIAEGTRKGSSSSSSSATAELCWLVPIMSFSIMVGLALDYDVFLVSRIYEFRFHHSYQHTTSIVAGLDATGGIITAAGLIMALSFGSLLTSASPALQQWSFLLTTAVLWDTFVMRSIVVPILANWSGPVHGWYPRRVSPGRIRWEGFDTEEDDDPVQRQEVDDGEYSPPRRSLSEDRPPEEC